MTYTVSSGMLNSSILYHLGFGLAFLCIQWRQVNYMSCSFVRLTQFSLHRPTVHFYIRFVFDLCFIGLDWLTWATSTAGSQHVGTTALRTFMRQSNGFLLES